MPKIAAVDPGKPTGAVIAEFDQTGELTDPEGEVTQVVATTTVTPAGPTVKVRVPRPEEVTTKPGEAPVDLTKRRRDVRGGYMSGFCTDALRLEPMAGVVELNRTPEEIHATCLGATTNAGGKTSLCVCPCHDHRPKCHDCKQRYAEVGVGYDAERRRCVDRAACATRIADAHREFCKTDPTMIQVRAIQAETSASREARKAAERAAETGEASDPRAEAARPTKGRKKAAGTPQRCQCGCGATTKGGRFAMGHDMKLKGRLFEVARNAGSPALERLEATAELIARGWSLQGIPEATTVAARTRVNNEGELAVLKERVFGRYDGVEGEIS